MITFISSYPHTYTTAALREGVLSPIVPETRAITYDDLFAAGRLKPGTYVFTDMERLHPVELRLAARFYRLLAGKPGFRVLNDPARVRTRYGLLRALAEAGLNDFDVYCADGLPKPRRFPVFVRIASDHAGPLGGLIEDQAELDARLNELETEGIPLAGVLVVEFRAERNAEGLYEKFAFFRIGDRITLAALLVGEHWNVKRPAMNLVTPETMRDHFEAMRVERHAQEMRRAFDIAGIEYGRADVGLCGGRLQVYEINTNPTISASHDYLSEEHRESRRIYRERLGSMLREIGATGGAALPVRLGELDGPSRRRRQAAVALKAGRRPWTRLRWHLAQIRR